jgi:archaellum component FlaC
MIIGKSGSAAYQPDMPIPEKYRFEKKREQIPHIIEQIRTCLDHYEELINDFKPYRDALSQEKKVFTDAIKKVFVIK